MLLALVPGSCDNVIRKKESLEIQTVKRKSILKTSKQYFKVIYHVEDK